MPVHALTLHVARQACTVTVMDADEAGRALDGWKARNWQHTHRLEQLIADRDQLIRDAYAAGINIRQIHLRAGISRDTIYRVLGKKEGEEP
jgi:hypothetical protein